MLAANYSKNVKSFNNPFEAATDEIFLKSILQPLEIPEMNLPEKEITFCLPKSTPHSHQSFRWLLESTVLQSLHQFAVLLWVVKHTEPCASSELPLLVS